MTKNLEEEDAGTNERGDDRPASDKEVTWVVADHVVHRESEPPGEMMMMIRLFLRIENRRKSRQSNIPISTLTNLAPKPQETAMHSKNMRKRRLIPK